MNTAIKANGRFNYWFGLLNFVGAFAIVWLLWYVFLNPNTVMKLYTPMYGFALLAVFLSSIVLMVNPQAGSREPTRPQPCALAQGDSVPT